MDNVDYDFHSYPLDEALTLLNCLIVHPGSIFIIKIKMSTALNNDMKRFSSFIEQKPTIRPFAEIEEEFDPYLGESEDDDFLLEKTNTTKTNVADMSPEQHKRHRQNEAEAEQWHKDHPVHHDNIIHHYNQATAEEKHQGHTWYSDAHHLAKTVAHDTKTPMHTMAGLISNYSPQTHWHTNIMTAAKVARHKTAVGGKGSGVFADERQKHAAHRMLSGEHYDRVLTGQKTHAFAHLIEHGGNKDPKDPKVVIDRHAHSVASGARMTDTAFGKTNLKSKKGYKHVSDAYHRAAEHLSKQHGAEIHPHQVQATTWLVRQRLNHEGEHTASGSSKTGKVAQTAKSHWHKYAGEHHPSIVGKEPGSGYAK